MRSTSTRASTAKGDRISLVAVIRASDGSIIDVAGALGEAALMATTPDVTTALDETGRRFAFRPAAILGNGSVLVDDQRAGRDRADSSGRTSTTGSTSASSASGSSATGRDALARRRAVLVGAVLR